MTKVTDKDKTIRTQCISATVTIGSIIISAINAIIGFIAVYFFKPVWTKIIEWWNNERKTY